MQLVLSQTDDDKKYRTEMQFQASNDPEFRSSDVIAWTMEGTEIPPHGDFYAFLVRPASYRYLRVSRPPKSLPRLLVEAGAEVRGMPRVRFLMMLFVN